MIDSDRLLETFLTILRINSFYPDEEEVMQALRPKLKRIGMELTEDDARNILGYWPGSGDAADAEPILLCAHVDTVRPTVGMSPVVRDEAVHSDGSSVLGADDKAAVAAIVEAAEAIADSGVSHPPIEVLLTIGEDVGHIGSRAFDISPVKSKIAYVPDSGGPVGQIILASPYAQGLKVAFHGRAAHAGIEPENGRSALQMVSKAIASLPWGRLDEESTSNVGMISGGEAANIVAPQAEMVFQVRSLSEEKHLRYIDNVLEACRRAAEEMDGHIEHEALGRTRGFRFDETDPIVERVKSAIRSAELQPSCTVSCGGSDANEFNAKGLSTLVISVGYKDIHSNEESMPIDELNNLARVCVGLMLGK
jgi:tripeptide aminopeptidase